MREKRELLALRKELAFQANVIGKSIDMHDKLVMEKRALEVRLEKLELGFQDLEQMKVDWDLRNLTDDQFADKLLQLIRSLRKD